MYSVTTYADWSHNFVVSNGKMYVISDIQVDPDQIESKIGEVTKYSDQEGTYAGNFSNVYPVGTEYFSIKGIGNKEAIAIKENDLRFIRANYYGYYNSNGFSWELLIFFISLIPIALLVIHTIRKRKNK